MPQWGLERGTRLPRQNSFAVFSLPSQLSIKTNITNPFFDLKGDSVNAQSHFQSVWHHIWVKQTKIQVQSDKKTNGPCNISKLHGVILTSALCGPLLKQTLKPIMPTASRFNAKQNLFMVRGQSQSIFRCNTRTRNKTTTQTDGFNRKQRFSGTNHTRWHCFSLAPQCLILYSLTRCPSRPKFCP